MADSSPFSSLKVAELRQELAKRGLPVAGVKKDLLARLIQSAESSPTKASDATDENIEETAAVEEETAKTPRRGSRNKASSAASTPSQTPTRRAKRNSKIPDPEPKVVEETAAESVADVEEQQANDPPKTPKSTRGRKAVTPGRTSARGRRKSNLKTNVSPQEEEESVKSTENVASEPQANSLENLDIGYTQPNVEGMKRKPEDDVETDDVTKKRRSNGTVEMDKKNNTNAQDVETTFYEPPVQSSQQINNSKDKKDMSENSLDSSQTATDQSEQILSLTSSPILNDEKNSTSSLKKRKNDELPTKMQNTVVSVDTKPAQSSDEDLPNKKSKSLINSAAKSEKRKEDPAPLSAVSQSSSTSDQAHSKPKPKIEPITFSSSDYYDPDKGSTATRRSLPSKPEPVPAIRKTSFVGAASAAIAPLLVTKAEDGTIPPPTCPPTNTVIIRNFVRPLKLPDVKELLEKYGEVETFWMDKIKTHCYVTYKTMEAAESARNSIYGLVFPPEHGRSLFTDFITRDLADEKIKEEENKSSIRMTELPPKLSDRAQRYDSYDGAAASQRRIAGVVANTLQSAVLPYASRDEEARQRREKEEERVRELQKLPKSLAVDVERLFRKTKTRPVVYWKPVK